MTSSLMMFVKVVMTFLSVCIQQETLPGFKWIGNRIHELTQTGNTVLFSFEESIGNEFIVCSGTFTV